MLAFLLSAVSRFDTAFIKAIRTLSVKARFFLMVIVISVIPILVIGIISCAKSNTDIASKISVYSLQLVKQLSLTINDKLLSWEQYGNIIATSEDVQDILEQYEHMTETDQYLASRSLQKIMQEALKVTLDIQEPDIITTNGSVISPMSYTTLTTSPFMNYIDGAETIKEMSRAADGSYIWYTDDIAKKGDKRLIVLSRSIKDMNTFNKFLGYLVMRVDTNYLYGLYENINLGSGSRIYLVDSNFMVVLSRDREEIGEGFSPRITESILDKYGQGYRDGTLKDADSSYLTAFSSIPTSDWTVVALIPKTYLNSLSTDIRNLVVAVGIICLMTSLLFFTMIYRSITSPLSHLIKSMREVKKGHMDWKPVDEAEQDEVGEVAASYNKMLHELSLHIENIKLREKQKAMAEFRALQAQINPHFIANTLNNVVWLAKMQKAENIETLANSLIHLLNSSMGRGGDLITVGEELQNIRSYISIQEYKYLRKISVSFELDEDILPYKILRFILQPIIENAIIHGIGPKQGQGAIYCRGYAEDGELAITITDTGAGMDSREIDRLLDGEKNSEDSFNGIGLKNVNERIKLSYGERYGLLIKSEMDMFTSVEIKLPVIL